METSGTTSLDKTHAFILAITLSLIGIGALAPPDQIGWIGKFALLVIGIVGTALKVAYGDK